MVGALLIASCGYKEGVIQKSDRSFLKFTGNVRNASVYIDEGEPFVLEKYVINSDGEQERARYDNKLYQVTPGKHTVKVYRDNNLVVKRILILDNNVIKEVYIP
jgi:hypothetical protein